MKLTYPRLIVAITFLAIFAMAVRPSADTDTWWHLRAGQWIVEHRAVPMADPFSHTRAGAEWKYPGWLVQAPLYWLFATFGYAGLNLFTAVCVTLAFVFVYLCCEGPPLLRAFALVLAAASSAIYWSARPQIVSFALAGVFAYILWRYRWRRSSRPGERANRLWVLVPLMAVWANAHGGFAIGFILLGLTLAGQAVTWVWRRLNGSDVAEGDVDGRGLIWLAGIGVGCAAAVMANPAGPVMLLYPFRTVSIGVLRDFIQEWQSPNFHERGAQIFLWLLFATLGLVGLSRRRVNFTDLMLVSGVAYLGFLAWRNVALLAIVAPPVLTRHAMGLWEDVREHISRVGVRAGAASERAGAATEYAGAAPERARAIALNWVLLALVALAALVKVGYHLQARVNEVEVVRTLPVGAADFVRRERPPGPMFNAYNFGAYLAWALYPEYPVYVDGRTDLYDDAFLREYLQVAFARPGYDAILEKHGVRLVIVEANSILSDRLAHDALWREAYRDAVAAVYQKVTP